MKNIPVYGVIIDGKPTLMCDGVPFKMEQFIPELPITQVVDVLKKIANDNRSIRANYRGE